MTLLDANVLLYAYNRYSPHHATARAWLERALTKGDPLALSWPTILAFLRISTNARIFRNPFPVEEASAIVSDLLARPNVILLNPGEKHWEIFRRILREVQVRGPLVTDAHLAALAVEHEATLATVDKDFARFPGLKFTNPLLD